MTAMTTTTSTTSSPDRTASTSSTDGTGTPTHPEAAGQPVTWRHGMSTGAVAAAVVAAIAGVLSAAGRPLALTDGVVPVLGFAQMVLLGALVGVVLARHTSRRTFLRLTLSLTALSVVPSIAMGATLADKLGLALTHVVAAAIIVPRLARR